MAEHGLHSAGPRGYATSEAEIIGRERGGCRNTTVGAPNLHHVNIVDVVTTRRMPS